MLMSEETSLVLLLDDDEGLREGVTWLFESEDIPVCSYGDFDTFREDLASFVASRLGLCLLLDLRMPKFSGLEVFEWIKSQGFSLERLPVIFLTGHGDISTAVEAVKNGAFDFYEKPTTDQRLIDRVQQALAFSHQCLQKRMEFREWAARISRLSPREREVMLLVAKGWFNKVIAAELEISMRTVEVHRANLFEKLKVRTAAELASVLSEIGPSIGVD